MDSPDFALFQSESVKLESKISTITMSRGELVAALELCIATTEILDLMKKSIFYGKEVGSDRITEAFQVVVDAQDHAEFGNFDDETELTIDPRLLHGIIGKVTEGGELLKVAVNALNGLPVDKVNLLEELGDDKWYDAIICDSQGLTMTQVLAANRAKLTRRYPKGFTQDAAINRNTDAERVILESH